MTTTISRYALFAVIAGLSLLILKEWNGFSQEYNEQQKQAILDQAKRDQTESDIFPADYNSQENNIASEENTHPMDQPTINDNLPVDTNQIDSAPVTNQATSSAQRFVSLTNDNIRISIDTLGAKIVQVELLKHLTELGDEGAPLKLLEQNALRTYIAFNGFVNAQGISTETSTFTPQLNQANNSIKLTTTMPNGVQIVQEFSLAESSYEISSATTVSNNSKQAWKGRYLAELRRDNSEDPGTEDAPIGMNPYLGTATTNEEHPYHKISFKDIAKENYQATVTGGWAAMIQHYFVSAWIPDQTQSHTFYTRVLGRLNTIGLIDNSITVEQGQSKTIQATLYSGPKDQYRMGSLAENLELTLDYGFLWWLSQPLYALLYFFATGELHIFDKVYKFFGGFQNWGLAIIALTFVVKAIFFKLSAASYRSMANMRRMQPKLLALKERHANDRAAQSKAMMELYQKEKINPLGGCLPMLIQMPVFIALYWALIESVELRHSPFFLWIKDLSVMDPLFILPLLMGATMWFQQRLNPTPPDPMQAKVMQWMPIIFTFFFLWFPAGLVIYWVSNNVLSIAQQWYITRKIEQEQASKA